MIPATHHRPLHHVGRDDRRRALLPPRRHTERERLEAAGMPKFLHLRQGPIQIAMHEAPLLGHAIEVHENTDAIHELFALFADAAEAWDGGEPMRPMPEG